MDGIKLIGNDPVKNGNVLAKGIFVTLAFRNCFDPKSQTAKPKSPRTDVPRICFDIASDLGTANRIVRSRPTIASEPSNSNILRKDQNRTEYKLLVQLLADIDAKNAHALAQELLREFGSLSKLLADSDGLKGHYVLKHNRLPSLLSSIHAICNHVQMDEGNANFANDDSGSVKRYLFANMAKLDVEEVRALYLDRQMNLASDIVIARGTLTEAIAPAREIFRHALAQNSAAIILVHNHPSGSCTPSEEDIRFTHHLVRTAKMLEISLVDHLIIARDGCTSLRDAGLMPPL